MFITSISLNVTTAFIIHRVPVIWILGDYTSKMHVARPLTRTAAISAFITSWAPILLTAIMPSAPYWAFGFSGAICSVFGADFVFASGTLRVANVVKGEQGLACGLFQMMTQVDAIIHACPGNSLTRQLVTRSGLPSSQL